MRRSPIYALCPAAVLGCVPPGGNILLAPGTANWVCDVTLASETRTQVQATDALEQSARCVGGLLEALEQGH
jgi:hypothetical protein